MPSPIQTPRLSLRPLKPEDFYFIRSLHTDLQVMKFIGDGVARTYDQTRAAVDKYLELGLNDPHLGMWVAYLKDSQIPVGNLLIRKPATQEETLGIEIGYSFAQEFWGQGFATEACRGILDYVKVALGPTRLVALIEPRNEASRNILNKLGFKSVGNTLYLDPATGQSKPTEILELKPLE